MPTAPNDGPDTEPRRADGRRAVTAVRDGPLLVEGPVRMTLEDGTVVDSDRFVVAICACRRSRTYPFCDTSHRRRVRR
ncbi:iron-binding protein [Saccharomonospora sp. CUA-673]|uniref:CDGSH iron-sulfur domain-containing protein n=1 Tax=Saccharomonospora sp. CUA-673 TaxID=1904969 RepID=UPI00095D42F0|nr:CDGSH iron-sulfur domain-containing protein [Saccharomonospora sp. CUA-673]OLT39982.1 iron-binding protein [Saccharomonospora sp. CUA-673]